MSNPNLTKVTLRVNKTDYEYFREMAELKNQGINFIIRETLATVVKQFKAIEQKHREKLQSNELETNP